MSKPWLGALGVIAVAAALVLLGWSLEWFDSEPRPALYESTQRSTDLVRDLRLMWETERPRFDDETASAPETRVATDRAINAASRVFNTVKLIGRSRTQVIDLIGAHNLPAENVNNVRFVSDSQSESFSIYRFTSGAYGWQFKVLFGADDKVVEVQRIWVP